MPYRLIFLFVLLVLCDGILGIVYCSDADDQAEYVWKGTLKSGKGRITLMKSPERAIECGLILNWMVVNYVAA